MTGPAAKAQSVTVDGEADGWLPEAGFLRDVGPDGHTQIVVSVPGDQLPGLHAKLVGTLSPPLGVLYRQVVDRRSPRPQGAPPRDFVAIQLGMDRVLSALSEHASLIYHDARCELWVRGALGEQLVLDTDGLMYCMPDDPVFEDALRESGLSAGLVQTLRERDYVKHWFHADHDAVEDHLIASLGMIEVAARPAR